MFRGSPGFSRLRNYSLPQIVESADRAYAAREEIENVRQSVELLQSVFPQPDNYKIAWRLSRALFFLGQEANVEHEPANVASSRNLHVAGAKAGRRASRLRPQRVEGHFWAGVNLALLAALEPRVKAALRALQARRALQRAIAIDAAYHSAGPLRVLARLQHKLPGWLGGGGRRALATFERAVRLAPANTVTRIYVAELWWEIGEATRARVELEQVLNARFDQDWAFEIKRDRLLAQAMLERLAGPEG